MSYYQPSTQNQWAADNQEPAQNGNYPGQYGQQGQYSSQHVYAHSQYQEGGPVQQPQPGAQQGHYSPQLVSYVPAYGGPQQSSEPSYVYQPQAYAQPQAQSPIPYNPATYANTNTSHFVPQYSPAAYSQAPTQNADPYAYSSVNYPIPGYSPQSAYARSPANPLSHFSPHPPAPSPRPQAYTTSPQPDSYGIQTPSNNISQSYQPQPQSQSTSGVAVVGQQAYGGTSQTMPAYYEESWMPPPPAHASANRSGPSPSALYPATSHTSFPSPTLSSTQAPTPPVHGLVHPSNTLDRYTQARSLPGPREPDRAPDYLPRQNGSGQSQLSYADMERLSQDELYSQVEDAVLHAGTESTTHSPSLPVRQAFQATTALFASNSAMRRNGSIVNGHLSPIPPDHSAMPSDPLGDESDVEAIQGLEMMYIAEQDEHRRRSGGNQERFSGPGSSLGSQRHSRPQATEGASDSDDCDLVDMSSLDGGIGMPITYGRDASQMAGPDSHSQTFSSQNSSMRRSNASQSSRTGYDHTMDSIHPFPPFPSAARVDASGTGGLSEPMSSRRRQSYDEGDESALTENQLPARLPGEPPDIYHIPASRSFSPGRPLPATPGQLLPPHTSDRELTNPLSYPNTPGSYAGHNAQGPYVSRSASVLNNSNTPQVVQPLRSKTDVEERRLRQQQHRATSMGTTFESTPASSVGPDLPLLGAKRFVPAKLGAPDFKKCAEPWAFSSIFHWLLTVVNPEQYTELKEAEITDALVALFTNKVPTMNIADAEVLSNRVVQNMYKAGTLATTEEWVKLVPGMMSGVIFQLTGVGCYSGTLHDHILQGRCYSRFCQRTLRKVNLQQAQTAKGPENWMKKWNLTAADVEGKDGKQQQLQHMLHETVYSEEVYKERLEILRTLYCDALARHDPSIIAPKRKNKFMRDVFGRLEAVYKANEEHLLPQLKYRQEEQGPWIVGFSDIFRQWIRKARAAYLEYAAGYPAADFMVRQEIERNLDFRNFLDRTSRNPQCGRLGWDTYLKLPITRLQRYGLLLDTIYKTMPDSDERRHLQTAITEVKAVTMECDTRVAEMQRKIDLTDLNLKLVLRPGMESSVELNLDGYGRELIHRGDLQRMGSSRFNWLDTHAILFDHYLVLSKPTAAGATDLGGMTPATQKYDVSRLPIPMDLLILESFGDPAVQKSNYVKGISTVTAVTGRTATPSDGAGLGRVPTNQGPGPGGLQPSASTNNLPTLATLGDGKDDKIMYPFRVKHLGRETYNLFASSENSRREWCMKILEAKTKHAAALYAQHAEPFHLRVMADSAFSFEGFAAGRSGIVIKGTPVDRAIKEVEHRFKDTGRPGPICRARVNCATSFTAHSGGKPMVAVGTDFGVFVSDLNNPRGWMKTITQKNVTQITVLEDFNLFILIADKVLVAYHLDVACPTENNGHVSANDSARKAPQKLSGSRDVSFFVTGRMKDRHLVFYKKKENLSSVFKVLEPIYQKSTEKKSRNVFKRGDTEFFREFDEFYIPAECSGMNLFHSSLAVSTARGFEVLTLDKKVAYTVPELKSPEVQAIAQHIKDQKALAMLRLTDSEFLLCYSNCAVYANKYGEVSRSVIMDFVGTAQSAVLYGAYLILFDSDFVEIRNASNGRLKQIIAGREIKCLDDGGSATRIPAVSANGAVNGQGAHEPRTVKFVMQHPESERTQIVVELLLNENMKE